MTAHVPALMPALPELILASGALLLVLIGALRGESSHGFVHASSVLLLGLALLAIALGDGPGKPLKDSGGGRLPGEKLLAEWTEGHF